MKYTIFIFLTLFSQLCASENTSYTETPEVWASEWITTEDFNLRLTIHNNQFTTLALSFHDGKRINLKSNNVQLSRGNLILIFRTKENTYQFGISGWEAGDKMTLDAIMAIYDNNKFLLQKMPIMLNKEQ